MTLTVLQVKNIKPRIKDFKVSDGGGLYLHVKANGAKYWRLAYRFNHKQKTLALGVYPEISLQAARELSADAKKLINNNLDPCEDRKARKLNEQFDSANSFQAVATEWFNKQQKTWVESHTKDVRRRLEQNIYPKIGHLSISQITPTQVLEALRVIEERGATDLAHRVRGVCSQVFRYAVACGKCTSDPTRDLKGALTPHAQKHQNAVAPAELPALMKDISTYDAIGDLQTKLGLEMLAHTFVRTGELIEATWDEFDFQKCVWIIPASRMKMKRDHLVPLTPQVVAILNQLKEMSCISDYVFSGRDQQSHISNNTLLFALYKLGYKGKMSGHGFRAIASTILNESGFESDHIEMQLAHVEGNSSRKPYNRAQYMKQRISMMHWWSDYLDNCIKSDSEQPEGLRLAA